MEKSIGEDGKQELDLVERIKLWTAQGVGYQSKCPVHKEKLHLYKQYDFRHGVMTTVWYLEGRCPQCSSTMRVSPVPNSVPRYMFG